MAAVNEDPTKELPGASPFERRVLAELAALRSEVGDIRGEVGGLRAEVGDIRIQVGGVRGEVDGLRAEVGDIRIQVGGVRGEVDGLRAEVDGVRVEVDGVRVEVGGLRSEVAEVRAQQMAMAKHFVALVQRLTSLEERVDNRLKETRPIWEAVRTQIEKLDEKFNVFIRDIYDVRGDIGGHEKRLGVLERRILS